MMVQVRLHGRLVTKSCHCEELSIVMNINFLKIELYTIDLRTSTL